MALGSKRFEEQQAKRKRGEPGTLIRSRSIPIETSGGERKAIGRICEVSLSGSCWVEALDLEGSKKP